LKISLFKDDDPTYISLEWRVRRLSCMSVAVLIAVIRSRRRRAAGGLHHDIRHRRQTGLWTAQDCQWKLWPASGKNRSVCSLTYWL